MKAWKFAGVELGKKLVELLRMIWYDKKDTISAEWRKSIVPLYKRGDKDKMENYKGISLLCMANKIHG